MSIYDIALRKINKEMITMNYYKKHVLLIVNVASKCAYTKQYESLENLYEKYHDKNFNILAFPCNQFLNQEPDNEKEIKKFCQLNYDVKFDLFSKVDVNGSNTHPLFKHLKEEAKGLLGSELIKWNFTKFLVDKEGNVIKRYSPNTDPIEIENDILACLEDKSL